MSKDVQTIQQDAGIWAEDRLNRAEMADRLTRYVCSRKKPFVISLNGAWGTGKTFFLERWREDLQEKEIQSIYFNAWEDDFCDDPLVAIIWQLAKFSSGIEKLREYQKPLEDFAKRLLVNAVSAVVGVTLPEADSAFTRYKEQEKIKVDLRSKLECMACAASGASEEPLVFIIDELDRCRPTFAIELLERVKHLLDVSGIVFVLGINRTELGKSIQSVYGNIDADVYLRRFFDMEFSLLTADVEEYCAALICKHELDSSHFKDFLPTIFGCLELSPRDIEHCIQALALAVSNDPDLKKRVINSYLLTMLVVLRMKDHALYKSFVQGESEAKTIVEQLAQWRLDRRYERDDQRDYARRSFANDRFDRMEVSIYAVSKQAWAELWSSRTSDGEPHSSTGRKLNALSDDTREKSGRLRKLADIAEEILEDLEEMHTPVGGAPIVDNHRLAKLAKLLELFEVPWHSA